MRGTIKAWWERNTLRLWLKSRIRFSRGKKLGLNVLLIMLVSLCLWGMVGYPLPTLEMEFRRMERTYLLPPSEILLSTGRITVAHSHEPYDPVPKVTQEQILGLGDDYAVAFWQNSSRRGASELVCWSFEEQEGQVKLAPLISLISDTRGEDWPERESCVAVAALELPQGTARGEMTLEAEEGIYQEGSEVLEHDLCLFAFQSRLSSYSYDWVQGLPYTLRFYDGAGELLLEQRGTVPQRG